MIKFSVQGKIHGKARPRVTKNGTYTPQKTKEYERLITYSYYSEYQNKYKPFFENMPLKMTITAYFAIPKTLKNKIANNQYVTKKPDADNIAKIVCDALNGIIYKDDNQIAELIIKKVYTDENPRLFIKIEDL